MRISILAILATFVIFSMPLKAGLVKDILNEAGLTSESIRDEFPTYFKTDKGFEDVDLSQIKADLEKQLQDAKSKGDNSK